MKYFLFQVFIHRNVENGEKDIKDMQYTKS